MSTTTSSGVTAPPLLPDTEKFDGTNYLEWRETILMACRLRGARGYLEGTIPKPTSPTSTTSGSTPAVGQSDQQSALAQSPTDTRWTSLTPSYEEWDTRDAWAMIAIRQNIKNPIGLGVKTDGSAAEAWASLESRYKTSNDLARVYAQRELRALCMNEGNDFSAHLANLHVKHQRANAVGANISNTDFHEIIIMSLPASWDNIISTLHTYTTSIDTIIQLKLHWSRVNRGKPVTAPGMATIALKANTGPIKI
ncbi:hypothetical protein C0991_006215, partial [Blastosporella zonata]